MKIAQLVKIQSLPYTYFGGIINKCMNWKQILKQLKHWNKIDQNNQDAFNKYCKTIAPDEYPPFIPGNCVLAFLDNFSVEIQDWLTYYLYEASTMKEAIVTIHDPERTYNFCKDKDVIKFFEDNYGIPKGVSQWKEYGEKMGYLDYFQGDLKRQIVQLNERVVNGAYGTKNSLELRVRLGELMKLL